MAERKRYEVDVEITTRGTFTVEAESEKAAADQARIMSSSDLDDPDESVYIEEVREADELDPVLDPPRLYHGQGSQYYSVYAGRCFGHLRGDDGAWASAELCSVPLDAALASSTPKGLHSAIKAAIKAATGWRG